MGLESQLPSWLVAVVFAVVASREIGGLVRAAIEWRRMRRQDAEAALASKDRLTVAKSSVVRLQLIERDVRLLLERQREMAVQADLRHEAMMEIASVLGVKKLDQKKSGDDNL
jgi:SH3-like domain-containing protein